jgi:hypothetical protein
MRASVTEGCANWVGGGEDKSAAKTGAVPEANNTKEAAAAAAAVEAGKSLPISSKLLATANNLLEEEEAEEVLESLGTTTMTSLLSPYREEDLLPLLLVAAPDTFLDTPTTQEAEGKAINPLTCAITAKTPKTKPKNTNPKSSKSPSHQYKNKP